MLGCLLTRLHLLNDNMKQCYTCKQNKELVEFGARKSSKDGLQGSCRVCVNAGLREWKLANKSRIIETDKKRLERTGIKGICACGNIFFYTPNKTKKPQVSCSKRCASLRPERRALQVKTATGNKNNWRGGRSIDAEWIKYHIRNGRIRREYGDSRGWHTYEEWKELLLKCGNKCVSCGVSKDEVHVGQDHIVPLCKGGMNTIDNIQPMCKACNCKKWRYDTNFINNLQTTYA